MISTMPTPATHLASAQAMLGRGELSASARRLAIRQPGPFMLGHTAPDVKTVSGHEREASHFFSVPRRSNRAAHQVLLDTHPALGDVAPLSPSHAAFVAGYLAHLLLDELWVAHVFQPFFLRDWAPLEERMFLHNVLRTWVDQRDQARLNGTVSRVLRTAAPEGWLPFIEDRHLRLWRDWLAEQLGPERMMETAEVLARRVGATAQEVEAVAQSPQQMKNRVFSHVPRAALDAFRQKSQRAGAELVNWYVAGLISGPSSPSAPSSPGHWCADLRATEEMTK